MSLGLAPERTAEVRERFLGCYRAALARDPALQGSVTLIGKVGPSGELVTVEAHNRASSRLPGELLDCLCSRLRLERLRPPEGGGAVLAVPTSLWLRAAAPAGASSDDDSDTIVAITRTQILIGKERAVVLPLPARDTAGRAGVDAAYKRSGPNDLFLTPLAERIERLRATGALRQPATVRIESDVDTPYRVLVEVLYTLGRAGFDQWILMRPDANAPRTFRVILPAYQGNGPAEVRGASAPKAALDETIQPGTDAELTVIVLDQGIRVASANRTLGPGCSGVAADPKAVTIPLREGAYDLAALASCAERAKTGRTGPGRLRFVATASTPYGLVLAATDVLRGDPSSAGYPLYDDLRFALLR